VTQALPSPPFSILRRHSQAPVQARPSVTMGKTHSLFLLHRSVSTPFLFRSGKGEIEKPYVLRVLGFLQALTSTSRSCGGRSSPMCCDSCCVCAAGSSGSFLVLSASLVLAARTKLVASATRPSRLVILRLNLWNSQFPSQILLRLYTDNVSCS